MSEQDNHGYDSVDKVDNFMSFLFSLGVYSANECLSFSSAIAYYSNRIRQ